MQKKSPTTEATCTGIKLGLFFSFPFFLKPIQQRKKNI